MDEYEIIEKNVRGNQLSYLFRKNGSIVFLIRSFYFLLLQTFIRELNYTVLVLHNNTPGQKNSFCGCERGIAKVLEPFKISEHLTILLCRSCGKEVARWEDKIKPDKREWKLAEQEAMR